MISLIFYSCHAQYRRRGVNASGFESRVYGEDLLTKRKCNLYFLT